jgi:hypothetical protein
MGYDYFKEFRELPIRGIFFGKNFKQNGEGQMEVCLFLFVVLHEVVR